MPYKETKQLLKRYRDGKCTEVEKAIIEQSILAYNEDELQLNIDQVDQLKREIFNKLPIAPRHKSTIKMRLALFGAAAIIVITLAVLMNYNAPDPDKTFTVAEKIVPIGNAATITLSDGRKIELANNQQEVILNGKNITYPDGVPISQIASNEYQTISTPRGGEYKIVLSDGTKVWLNAATVLQYPTSFREEADRRVKLVSGEAYFEVAKDKKHPFIVSTANQRLTVLGTHFNINAYTEEIKRFY